MNQPLNETMSTAKTFLFVLRKVSGRQAKSRNKSDQITYSNTMSLCPTLYLLIKCGQETQLFLRAAQARLGVSRPIYVNVNSPYLGLTYFYFLGGTGEEKNHPVKSCIFEQQLSKSATALQKRDMVCDKQNRFTKNHSFINIYKNSCLWRTLIFCISYLNMF